MDTDNDAAIDHTQRTPRRYRFVSTDPLERILDVLRTQYLWPTATGDGWSSRCPAHDDHTPSLSIHTGADGRVLVHCHAGCSAKQVVESIGLTMADLFPEDQLASKGAPQSKHTDNSKTPLRPGFAGPPPRGAQGGTGEGGSTLQAGQDEAIDDSARSALACYTRTLGAPGARWDYHDAQGRRVGMILRWDTTGSSDDGHKPAKEIRPIALVDGQWRCGGMPTPRPLYRLPEVLGSGGVVLVCEGEKACEAARVCGYVATTSAHGCKGASKSDWGVLRDRDVVIVPDLDAAGDAYAHAVHRLLAGIARSVRVINLRDAWDALGEGDDLDDALVLCDGDAGRLRAKIAGLIERAQVIEPAPDALAEADDRDAPEPTGGGLMSERSPCDVTWLEQGRIAMGKVNMLAGDPGLGKSFITLDLAARVSRGEIGTLPDGSPGRVVLMSAEDDPNDTLAPRLIAMGADTTRVRLFEGFLDKQGHAVFPDLDRDAERFGRWVSAIGSVSLIVIDPISAYMGTVDSHKNAEVRGVLAKLSKVAESSGAAVLCVTHLNKDSGNTRQAIYRTMGSLAFTAAARTVQLVTKHPAHDDDPDAAPRRVVSMVKNNLGAMLEPRVYTLRDGRLEWLPETVRGDADVFASGQSRFVSTETKGDRAVEFLERMLQAGAQPAREVFERGAAMGLSKDVLRAAKDTVGAITYKHGKAWYWSRDGGDDSALVRDAVETELDEPPLDLGGHGEFGSY